MVTAADHTLAKKKHVVSFEVKSLQMPLVYPFVTAKRRVVAACDVLVVLKFRDFAGLGTAAPTLALTGEWVEGIVSYFNCVVWPSLQSTIHEFFENLESCYPKISDFPNHHQHQTRRELLNLLSENQKVAPHNCSAKGALECAILDLFGQVVGLNFCDVLAWLFVGTHYTRPQIQAQRINSSATISLGSADQSSQELLRLWSIGYRCFKIKVGGDCGHEKLRLQSLLQCLVSLDTDLKKSLVLSQSQDMLWSVRLDANESQDTSTAETEAISGSFLLWCATIFAPHLEMMEQPFSRLNQISNQRLAKQWKVPIYADESLFHLNELQNLSSDSGFSGAVVKLTKAGGPFQALKWLEICDSKNLQPMLSCMLESPVALTAAVGVARFWVDYCGKKLLADLDAVDLLKTNPFKSPWDNRKTGELPEMAQEFGLGCHYIDF